MAADVQFMSMNKGEQGSIGPLSFTILINELQENLSNSTTHLYADGAILHTTAPSARWGQGQVVQNSHSDTSTIQYNL